MVRRCSECDLEYSPRAPFNHTAWCSQATTKDWPIEILHKKKIKGRPPKPKIFIEKDKTNE